MSENKAYRTQVTIPQTEGAWLLAHPEYTASGLLTTAIRREMLKEKEFVERRRGPQFER